MSTDLQFRPSEFQPIRLPTIRITPPRASAGDEIQTPKSDHRVISGGGVEELTGGGCRTPTSLRHKIPEIVSCPGAPRKERRMMTSTCKRKLFDVDFFEHVGREEIESFFRSHANSSSNSNSSSRKRVCPCP